MSDIQAQIQNLLEEIAFQRVLLESIDDSVLNREVAQKEIEDEILTLQRQVKALKRGTTAAASSSSSTQQSSAPTQTSSPRQKSAGGAIGLASTSSMAGFQDLEWHSSSNDSPVPNSQASPMKLPNRKRSHSNHLDGLAPYEESSKSRRTSPSPYTTGPPTPSTISSDDDAFAAEFLQMQKEEERRRVQEKADADFARSLQTESGFHMNLPSSTGPSAYDRMSGVRQPSTTLFARPHHSQGQQYGSLTGVQDPKLSQNSFVPAAGNNAYHQSMTSNMKPPTLSISEATQKGFRSSYTADSGTYKATPSLSRPMPGTFRDDLSEASDSDIEIIDPEAFHPNQKSIGQSFGSFGQPKSNQDPLSSSNLHLVGQAASNDALKMEMYGSQMTPSWMDAAGLASQSGMSISLFGHVYTSVLSTGLGYSVNMPGGFGSGDQLAGFPDALTMRDPLAAIIARSSAGNFFELSNHLNLNAAANDQLEYIMNHPRKNMEEIKALLENIRPDEDLPPEDREGTPEGLIYPLYEHQKLALTWLKSMEEGTNKGGILADDMGLGKTISALALMLSRPSQDRARKTNLVVGPVALVRQWEKELKMKVKAGQRLSTHLVHGQGRKLTWDELRNYDVILTTYGTLSSEFKKMEKWILQQKAASGGEFNQAPMAKLFPLLGPKSLFYRVFLDEAQCIKNKATMAAKAACSVKSLYRFCLTGTPMMNNVGELYSLIHFLRIKPYNEYPRFQQTFGNLSSRTQHGAETSMRKLQAILKAILLRRTKTSLIDGKPIIELPPKTEEIQHVLFSDDEQDFYRALEAKTQIQYNKYLKAGTVGKNYSNILVLLLRLRQACCHPHLIRGDFEEATPAGADIDADTMVKLAQSLSPDVVARLLAQESFECPICYDAAENPRIIVPCGHDTCSECLTKITDQAVQQHVAEGNEEGACRCPTCRGELKMTSIIDLLTFRRVHDPKLEAPSEDEDGPSETESEHEDSSTESDSDSDTESDNDANDNGDLRGFIVSDDISSSESEEDDAPAKSKKRKSKAHKTEKQRFRKAKGKEKEKAKAVSLAILKKEASRSAEHRRRYMKFLKKNWEPSAKVDKCVELLEKFQNDGRKTIIFSQFVTLLDLLQVPIDQKGWQCLRYDGAMSADQRHSAVSDFQEKANQNIMLISLKAGNAGLNLVAASRVIILDPFWNPYIEMQAVDRAYRIGQQNSVEVHRILIEGTVEDRIIELQERKRKLVSAALDEGAAKNLGRLGERELGFLFGLSNGQ